MSEQDAPYYLPPPDEPVIRVTLTVGLSPQRQIGFETGVLQSIDAAALDRIADKMTHVADRLQAKVELIEHEKQIRILRHTLDVAAKSHVQRTEEYKAENDERSPGRRIVRMTVQQKTNLDQIQEQIKDLKEQIALREESIAQCRRLIGGDEEPLPLAAE
jgi:3-hydroxyacyl-CoA dehydrogenase